MPRCYPPEPGFGSGRTAERQVWEILRDQPDKPQIYITASQMATGTWYAATDTLEDAYRLFNEPATRAYAMAGVTADDNCSSRNSGTDTRQPWRSSREISSRSQRQIRMSSEDHVSAGAELASVIGHTSNSLSGSATLADFMTSSTVHSKRRWA